MTPIHSTIDRPPGVRGCQKIQTTKLKSPLMSWSTKTILKMFGLAVFEVKELSMLNFEVTISKICNHFWKFDIFIFAILTRISLWGTIKKTNKSELWNRLSYRGPPYFFVVGSQTFRNYCKILRSQPIHKYFESSIKSMEIFQILMGGMNFRERSQKKPVLSSKECH